MSSGSVTYFQITEIVKTIKDEFAFANGNNKKIKKMTLTNLGDHNWKVESWYES